MRYLLLFLLMGIGCCSYGHDVAVAHFNLTEKEDRLLLDMEFDFGGLVSAIAPEKDPTSLTNRQVKKYIDQHLQLTINHRSSNIRIDRITKKGHHIYVQATISKPRYIIEHVIFENTCLVDTVPDHHNVLMTDINCLTRGFQLTTDRRKVSFSY